MEVVRYRNHVLKPNGPVMICLFCQKVISLLNVPATQEDWECRGRVIPTPK